jgi:hypothetical protein
VCSYVVERALAVHLGDVALVSGRRRVVETALLERRETGPDPVVHGVAVRPCERDAVVGRDEGRLVEPALVVRDPGRDDDRAREHTGEHAPPAVGPPPRNGDDQQRDEQDELGARERGQPAQPAERGDAPRCRLLARHHSDVHGSDDDQPRDRFRHDEPVIDPDVRRERGDSGRDETDAITTNTSPEQPDEEHEQRSEHDHRVALLAHVGVDGIPGDRGDRLMLDEPRHRRQDHDRERRVVGRGRRGHAGMRHVPERLDEPVALREAVGLRVVEQLIADRARTRVHPGWRTRDAHFARSALRNRDVCDAHAEADYHDGQQRPPALHPHGTSTPVNASTDAATSPATASTSTTRSVASSFTTSAAAKTNGTALSP